MSAATADQDHSPTWRYRALSGNAAAPAAARPGDAGADLRSAHRLVLASGTRAPVGTGIAIELESGHAGLVLPRSGLARNHGVTVANAPGLIDSGYRGEIVVVLVNHGDEPFTVEVGDRIAQLVVIRFVDVRWVGAAELSDSARGDAGFGSTGTG